VAIKIYKGKKQMFKSCDKCGEQIGGALYLADRLQSEIMNHANTRSLLEKILKDGIICADMQLQICEFLGHPKREPIKMCYCGAMRRYK